MVRLVIAVGFLAVFALVGWALAVRIVKSDNSPKDTKTI